MAVSRKVEREILIEEYLNEIIELFQMASSMKAKNRNMDSIISFPKPTK